MEFVQMAWLVIFLLLQCCIVILYYLIAEYLNSKPLGRQTLLDSVTKDFLWLAGSVSTLFSAVVIISRFEAVASLFSENEAFAATVCSLVMAAYAAVSVNIALVIKAELP